MDELIKAANDAVFAGDLVSANCLNVAITGSGAQQYMTALENLGASLERLRDAVAAALRTVAASDWQPIETAPKNGTPIWAYLFDSGVKLVRWMSAAESAETYGGTADNYYGSFVEVHDVDEEWSPKYWLPADALPPVPAD